VITHLRRGGGGHNEEEEEEEYTKFEDLEIP